MKYLNGWSVCVKDDEPELFNYMLYDTRFDSRYQIMSKNVITDGCFFSDANNVICCMYSPNKRKQILSGFMLGKLTWLTDDDSDIYNVLHVNVLCASNSRNFPRINTRIFELGCIFNCKYMSLSSIPSLLNFYKRVYNFSFIRYDIEHKAHKTPCDKKSIKIGRQLNAFQEHTMQLIDDFCEKNNANSKKQKNGLRNKIGKLCSKYIETIYQGKHNVYCDDSDKCIGFENFGEDFIILIKRYLSMIMMLNIYGYSDMYDKNPPKETILLSNSKPRISFSKINEHFREYGMCCFYGFKMYSM